MPYLSASAVMIHEEALYQVYAHLPLPLPLTRFPCRHSRTQRSDQAAPEVRLVSLNWRH